MLSRIFGFLVFGAILAAVAFNIKPILTAGQAQLVSMNAQQAITDGNWPKAIETYEGALREYPRNMEVALQLGWLYQQAKQFDKAEQIYQSVLKLQPTNLSAQMGLAAGYAQQPESFNNAITVYRKALKSNAKDSGLLIQIGNLYKLAAENPQETREPMKKWLYDHARYYYQQALRLDPKQFQAQFNVGVAYQQQQNLQPAATAYCQSLLLDPNSYEARYNLGLVLSELDYLDEAYRQMGQAVQLASTQAGEDTAMQIAQRVQNVKNSIYNNTEKHGLAGTPIPEFLNKECLVTLGTVDTEEKSN